MTDTTTKPSKTYNGNCHCGEVKYTVTASPPFEDQEIINCNCSICSRNGYLLAFVPPDAVSFTSGNEANLTPYEFGSKKIAHYFCGKCGSSVYARPSDGKPEMDITCVNVRMLKDLDLEKLKLKPTDGKKADPQYPH